MTLKNSRLDAILSTPTAPFRERQMLETIEKILKTEKIPHFRDPGKNLIVGVASKAEYRKKVLQRTKDPLRLVIAHLDHPGFHATEWIDDEHVSFQWHGGSPTEHLVGARVWLADSEGFVGEGRIESVDLAAHGKAMDRGTIRIKNLLRKGKAKEIFGGLGFRSTHWQDGELLYTKAADDLIGAFAIVETAIALKKKKNSPFIGLLTRAEEVGFIGALQHLELGWLKGAKRPLLALSLETSRALPQAEIGKGPVVRLGDRTSLFDPAATQALTELARRVLPGAHQRRIMDGGTCEGTATSAYRIPTIALSVPLGNYHNQSFEGGPDAAPSSGPAPEFVSTKDIEGLIKLTQAVILEKINWQDPYQTLREGFKKSLKKYGSLFKSFE